MITKHYIDCIENTFDDCNARRHTYSDYAKSTTKYMYRYVYPTVTHIVSGFQPKDYMLS